MPAPRVRPARPGWADVGLGVLVTLLVTVGSVSETGDAPSVRPQDWVSYVLFALGGAALVFRRTAPTATFAVTLGLGLLYQGFGYPGGPQPLVVVVAVYTVAVAGDRQRALGFGLVAAATLVTVRSVFVPNGFASPLLVAFPIAVVAALYAGQVVAGRRTQQLEAAAAALQAERERERDTQRRVDAERLRIARELHDVVAHNISLIHVQAAMGVHLADTQPDAAAEALRAVKGASKQALGELRRILDVLRAPEDAEPTAPPPGLADLASLVDSTRSAGLPIEVRVMGTPSEVPATVDVAAYRIVQESLTNALRYAGNAPTRVTVRYNTATLGVEVADDGREPSDAALPGTGHGLPGMRERAAAVGGTVAAGHRRGGGFVVRAELPLLTP